MGNVAEEAEVKEPLWTKEYLMGLFIMFGVSITMNMLFSTIAVYGKGLTGSDMFAGTLASMFTLAALCTRGVMGFLFSRLSLKQVLLLGMGISTLASFGYIMSDNQVLLVLFRIMHGIGFGISGTAGATVVSTSLPKSRLLEGVGYSGLTGTVAMALGPSIALSLCDSNWLLFDRVFYMNAGLTVFVFICSLFVKVKSAPVTRSKQEGEDAGKQAGKVLTFVVMFFLLLSFMVTLLQSSISALLSVCALERNMGNISLYFTLYAAASFVSRLIMPKLVNITGETRLLQCCLVVLAATLLIIAFNYSPLVLFALSIPYGLACGMKGPLFNVKILNEVTYEQQGTANAAYYASVDAGMGLGALVWSAIAGAIGYTAVYAYAGVVGFGVFVFYCLTYKRIQGKKLS